MNFPKKQIATVIKNSKNAKIDSINKDYNQRIAAVNTNTSNEISSLNQKISDNKKSKNVSFSAICFGIGLVIGFFICVSKCSNNDSIGSSIGPFFILAIVGAVIGFILDTLANGAANADTKSCEQRISSLNNSKESQIRQLENQRQRAIQAAKDEHERIADNYATNFRAQAMKEKREMLGRTDPVYLERMDDLVKEVGEVLAKTMRGNFGYVASSPSGDFVNQFVTGTLSFHVFADAIAFNAGATSFTFMEKGLLPLTNDEETYAMASVLGERVVSYIQGLPSEALDGSGREYAAGRKVTLTAINDVYNESPDRYSWEIYDNKYDVYHAAYVKVEITCKCVNSQYAPPV